MYICNIYLYISISYLYIYIYTHTLYFQAMGFALKPELATNIDHSQILELCRPIRYLLSSTRSKTSWDLSQPDSFQRFFPIALHGRGISILAFALQVWTREKQHNGLTCRCVACAKAGFCFAATTN